MAHLVFLDCPGNTFADLYTKSALVINKSVYHCNRLSIGVSRSVGLTEQEEDAVPAACCKP